MRVHQWVLHLYISRRHSPSSHALDRTRKDGDWAAPHILAIFGGVISRESTRVHLLCVSHLILD